MAGLAATTGQHARAPFHVLVKPIGALCNLDCEYCYYLDKASLYKGSKFRMSDEILETHIREYIGNQPEDCREVNFTWQGGEPTLLGVDFFRKVVELQRTYGRPGLKITNALQTNGTKLNDEWCQFLTENQFLVGISLDGPEALHDRFRKTKRGKGSFHLVKQGLDNLIKHGTEFNVLTVVQRDNGDQPQLVYESLKAFGAKYLQFIPIVERKGANGVSSRSVKPVQFGNFMIEIFELWRRTDVGGIFVQHFDTALGSVMGYGEALCVHARQCGRAVALEHNGDVYSCDHYVFDDYRIGNITNRRYVELVDGDRQTAFGVAKEKNLTPKCRSCAVLDLCNGGCPAHQLIPVKNSPHHLNYLCEGYERFFKHMKPFLVAMGEAIRNRLPAHQYFRFMSPAKLGIGRNDPCPCNSGKKYKQCCGR